jgi:hypothetical protein
VVLPGLVLCLTVLAIHRVTAELSRPPGRKS